MAEINKGTKCYVKNPGELLAYKEYFFPSQLQRQQSFGGDAGGAAEAPRNKIYLQGDYLGDALGHTQMLSGIEYQLLSGKGSTRTAGGFLGMGAGVYIEHEELIYVESSNISTDQIASDEISYRRSNAEKIKTEQAAAQKQKLVEALVKENSSSSPLTANASPVESFKLSKLLWIIFAFISLVIMAVLSWKAKQDKIKKQEIYE